MMSNKIIISKLKIFTDIHSNFIINIYNKHNSKTDSNLGNKTLLEFISIFQSNKRISKGSIFFEVTNAKKELIGIIETEKNHLTLLYIKNDNQHNGIGTLCIEELKSKLGNYSEITVCASPYSVVFYVKNGFKKIKSEIQETKGINYYHMKLDL